MVTDLELNACQAAVMSFEGTQALAAGNIPEDHPAISTGAHDPVTVQSDGIDGTIVPAQRRTQFQSLAIPDADERVFRAEHNGSTK